MDQSLDHHALYPSVPTSLVAPSTMLAVTRPIVATRSTIQDADNQPVRRAGTVIAAIGRRLALAARHAGQPADTFAGSEVLSPEDIRNRYILGLYGGGDVPTSLRDSNRRW